METVAAGMIDEKPPYDDLISTSEPVAAREPGELAHIPNSRPDG